MKVEGMSEHMYLNLNKSVLTYVILPKI